MSMHQPYQGTADEPLPPVAEEGWSCITSPDHPHFAAAQACAASGVLGELPVWHAQDVVSPTGLYRFFHYETPVGGQLGAMHFDGVLAGEATSAGLLGAAGDAGNVSVITNNTDGNGDAYTLGGSSGAEPIPSNTAACTWIPDATNSAIVAMAKAISNGSASAPVPYQNQAVYNTTQNGVQWKLVMWSGDCVGDGGTYHCVSTFRCQPGSSPNPPGPNPNPAPSASSSSSSGVIFAIILAALGLGGAAAYASHKKHA